MNASYPFVILCGQFLFERAVSQMENQTLEFHENFQTVSISLTNQSLYKGSSLHDIIIPKYSIELIIPRLLWPDGLWPDFNL